MSIRIIAVVAVLATLMLSGCISNPLSDVSLSDVWPSSGASPSAASTPAPRAQNPETTKRAGDAALAAMGAEVVATKSEFRLCSLVDEYRLCGGRPCQKGGLKATTYFVCRVNKCAGLETPTEGAPAYGSQKSCVAGCRKAERQWRAKRVPLETFYCTY